MSRLRMMQVWLATVVLSTGLAVRAKRGCGQQHSDLYRKS